MKNTEEKTKHTSAPELEVEDLDEEDEDDLDEDNDEDDDDDKDRYGFDLSPNGDDDRYATARGWEPPNKYKKLLDKYRKEHPLEHFHESIFVRESLNSVFTADTCAEPTQQLFGDLVRTGELTILFADTGVGKSILAVQIGDAVARGKSVLSEPGTIAAGSLASENSQFATLNSQLPKNDSPARPVIYIDFEMTRSQVAERYSAGIKKGKYLHRYRFRNMERLCLEWDDELPTGFTSLAHFIGFSVWEEVKKKKVGLLIIDNISYLTSGQGAKEALILMKSLKSLKDEYGLAILVLAHTPKRSFAKHLSINDLAGRKELSNFIDNSFAIGRSHLAPDLRYIKQMKQRNRPETFGDDNVILCRLEKPHNFPKFTFLECTGERQHLLRPYEIEIPCLTSPHVSKGSSTATENTHPFSGSDDPRSKSSPPYEGGVASVSDDGVVLSSTHHSSPITHHSPPDLRSRLIAEARRLSRSGHSQRSIARTLGISLGVVNKYLASQNRKP